MIYIENSNSSINLLKNVPKDIIAKLNITPNIYTNEAGEIEVVVLYGEGLLRAKKYVSSIGATLEDLGYGYGIVTLTIDKLDDLAKSEDIQYIELPKNLFLTDSMSNRVVCVENARDSFNLDGSGTLVGFIDTGIEYTHPAFLKDDGTTRIEYLLDLSKDYKVYTKEQINEALKAQDPLSVVPFDDIIEHGTHVAGIACAGGKIDKMYYGVSPKSSIIMVKSGRGRFSLSTKIMRGLKFLIDKGRELQMPLAINISLSTNDGAHNGTSLLEQYINTISTLERVSIVIAAGNEGDAAHHKGGKLEKENRIIFNVAEDESYVVINFYKSVLPQVTIELISPAGASTGEIVVQQEYKEGVISQNQYQIYDTGPKPFDINGEIGISLYTGGNYILSGQWTIVIRTTNNYEGVYDMWLPISEGLNKTTKFLSPTVDNTLGIPGTVGNVITVGSYNYISRDVSSFSGRGKVSLYYETKPDLLAPGENIYSSIPNGSYDRKSGTSMATPHVTGICSLLMQWGIIKGNDPILYGSRLKKYLLTGAKREREDVVYPDPSRGYGTVCLYNSLEQLIDVLGIQGQLNNNLRGVMMDRQYSTVNEYINQFLNTNEIVGLIVEYSIKEDFLKLNNKPNTTAIIINESYGIVYLPANEVKNLSKDNIKEIFENNEITLFTLNNISPIEASDTLQYHDNPYLSVDGNGVIIGILDTGIDYLNTEFQREDDTTRILSIWDQTIDSGKEVYGLKLGTEYTQDQINEAIKASKAGGDPYSIVPSRDTNGHGTAIAGIAGARGKNPDLTGVAPGSDFLVVKLSEASKLYLASAVLENPKVPVYDYVNILTAIRYMSVVASNLKRPIVILFAVGANQAPHDGLGILSSTIDNYSRQAGTAFVIGTGNEGDTDTHTEGRISRTGDTSTMEIKVGENQKTLSISIWIDRPDVMTLSVTSPSGEVIDRVPLRSSSYTQNSKFLYEGTVMSIEYDVSSKLNGDELIVVKALNMKEGVWQFKLYGDYIVNGRYNAWLPQRPLLDADTRFLSSTPYTTLSEPSSARLGISVGYYNQDKDSIVGAAGRGYTRDGRKKPDIAAGGIGASIITPEGRIGTASGSSVAAAIVTGVTALLLQWAVIDKNNVDVNAEQIISYIIRGAKQRNGDEYPNREWGYGQVNMTGIFDAIRGQYGEGDTTRSKDSKYDEFYIDKLFIRKPN